MECFTEVLPGTKFKCVGGLSVFGSPPLKLRGRVSCIIKGNRLVGIISHVAELKEKIDKQIIVTKDKLGGSSATIKV